MKQMKMTDVANRAVGMMLKTQIMFINDVKTQSQKAKRTLRIEHTVKYGIRVLDI